MRGVLTFLCILSAFAGGGAQASFRLIPMSVTFQPEGPGATQSFQLENDSDEKIAIQIHMAERKMALDGSETHPPADALFNVFPSQLILDAKSSRTIRVTWTGDKKPQQELAYRLIAEQLPISALRAKQNGQAVLNILLRYVASIYVNPEGTYHQLEVKSLEKTVEKGKPMLSVVIENKGTMHGILASPQLKVSDAGKEILTLKDAALAPLSGHNVLPGHTRKFLVPWPTQLNGASTLKGGLTVK